MPDQLSEELKDFREEHLGVVDKVDYYRLTRRRFLRRGIWCCIRFFYEHFMRGQNRNII